MFALVDCNNFYVSCERVFQPQFKNKPVVVLSNNDGCVISRSDEAKALGIAMGVPEFKIRNEIIQQQIAVFSSNYALYGDLSKRVMETLSHFTPDIENYSIDEAFLNFKNTNTTDFETCGLQMKKRVQKWIGIPVCVGFGETKALSKIANRIAKKFQDRTGGVYVIDSDEKRVKALKWTKVEDIWGIGFRLAKKMKAFGMVSAYDFIAPHNEDFVIRTMGVVGKRLRAELSGFSVLELEQQPEAKKSIAVTRTFEKAITNFSELKERVSTFATVASEKLRMQKSCCYGIILYLRKDKYKVGNERYNFSVYETLPFATQSSLTLSTTAIKMLEKLFQTGEIYTKAGIIITDIIPQDQKQFNLFVEENPKHEKLMKVMDDIRKKTGERKIRLGNQDLNRTWKMKQNFLSKKFTTDITELLHIKC
ncbi:Y-family DNA polymerase [Flavobacterium difficile]|uniref:Y-family DNA polymerase n=1 Tax=Flavobacterium difficile TaxID=2709659 RepID=A0ABX0I5L1_9FLAO|nr:Y-family DNA polymerase [Flavobacterium difficile]NHM02478.1 Y-family DNA polymerase [Flavobacterium difficile]